MSTTSGLTSGLTSGVTSGLNPSSGGGSNPYPDYRDGNSSSYASGTTSTTHTLPATVQEGDLIVLVICANADTVDDPTTGYTQRAAYTGSSDMEVWTKIAGASEADPTLNFTGTTGSKMCVCIVYKSGVNDYTASTPPDTTYSGVSTMTSGSWTDDSGMAIVVWYIGSFGARTVSTPPADMNDRGSQTSTDTFNYQVRAYDLPMDNRGSISRAITWSGSATGFSLGFLLEIT